MYCTEQKQQNKISITISSIYMNSEKLFGHLKENININFYSGLNNNVTTKEEILAFKRNHYFCYIRYAHLHVPRVMQLLHDIL